MVGAGVGVVVVVAAAVAVVLVAVLVIAVVVVVVVGQRKGTPTQTFVQGGTKTVVVAAVQQHCPGKRAYTSP